MSTKSFIAQLDEARALAADLLALEEQMSVTKKRLEDIIGGGVIPAVTARSIINNTQQPVKQLPENMGRATLTDKLVEALRINEGVPMSSRELSTLVKDNRLETIHSMLVRLSKKGQVSRSSKGRYVWLREQARV